MWRAKLPFALLLLLCLMMLVDQFLFATQEKTGFVDQATLVEKYPRVQYRRWRRWNEKPGPTWNKYHYDQWYVAHLANGRWFQIKEHDNGVLMNADSVIIAVAPISGRVLRYHRLSRGPSNERATVDAFEDMVPFPVLIASLSIWLVAFRTSESTAYFLRMAIIVITLSFLLALFAISWPSLKLMFA